MEQDEIERTLLCSIKTPEHLNILRQTYKLAPRHFPFYFQQAEFIWDYVTKWGIAPDLNLLSVTFPDFQYTPTDAFEHIAELFRKDFVRRSIYITIDSYDEALKVDSESGLVGLLSSLHNLERHDESLRVVVDSKPLSRFDEYKLRADGMAKERLWWGIEPFDNYPVMFLKGSLVGLIADTKVGKSWLSLKIALTNYLHGSKTVIISPELSRDFMEARIDTILAYEKGFPISMEKIMFGTPGIEENYLNYLHSMDRSDLIFYQYPPNDKFTVSAVESIIKSDKPDIILLDGIYLMQDEDKANSSWEKIENIMKGLQAVAKSQNVGVLITNQTGRNRDNNGSSSTPPQGSEVAYGYGFNRMVDVLVTVGGSANSPYTREVSIPLIRSGRSVEGSFEITFEADSGDIGRSVVEVPAMSLDGFNI